VLLQIFHGIGSIEEGHLIVIIVGLIIEVARVSGCREIATRTEYGT